MFMDIPAGGEGEFEPILPRCRSCHQPIAPDAPHDSSWPLQEHGDPFGRTEG